MKKNTSKRNKGSKRYSNLIIGIILIAFLIMIAVFANYIAPYSYDTADLSGRFVQPGREHLFGTDYYGRDVFSRVIYGSRIALRVALISVAIQLLLGVSIGLASGFYGGY